MNDPQSKMDVSVVVPIYNEEENVELLCAKLYKALSALKRS